MAKVPATVVMVTLAGAAPATEPQVDAPCAMRESACRVSTPKADDHPHHVAPTVAPVRPAMGFAQLTRIAVTPVP
jgi:hypothetical protein